MDRWGVLALSLVACVGLPPPLARGDELADLQAHVQRIEAENRQIREANESLNQQLQGQQKLTARLVDRVAALEQRGNALSQQVEAVSMGPPEPALEMPAEGLGGIEIGPVRLKGFADVGFTTKLTKTENSNTAILGPVVLFTTSDVTDRLRFLLETDFFSPPDTNAATFRLQRALIKYTFSDLVNVTLGRIHTPLGHWNESYHHGTWLQTTISRPEILLFEGDDGGFLPVHSVGFELSGTLPVMEVADVEYVTGLYNGRGRTITEVQHVRDKNDAKALSLMLTVKPYALHGLTVGALLYHDEIPANPPTATRREAIGELIIGEHLIYQRGPVELLGELFQILHDDQASGEEFDSLGLYLQGSYQLNERLKPYYRFDYLEVANADPYYTAPRNVDRNKHTWGLRWDILPWNALKFEYIFTDVKQQEDEHALAVNTSIAF